MEKINPPSKEELIELRKSKTIKEIATMYFVHENLVGKWIKDYKLTKKLNRVTTSMPAPSKNELVELRKVKTIKEIAEIYIVHESTVSRWLRRYGMTKMRKVR